MKGWPLLALLLAAGCQAQPRSASYFEARPEEAARVVAACREGRYRGADCDSAAEGLAAIEANRRMELFKRSFE